MKPLIPIFVIVILLFTACNKQQQVTVEYEASTAVSAYELSYQNEFGILIDTLISPQSSEDVWHHSMKLPKGDIVYLSGKYDDINSSLKLSIKIDGKIYQEQYSVGDTVHYVIVSGTIPY